MSQASKKSLSESVIKTDRAVQPVGPFSQAVRAGDFVYISGTVPVDSSTGQIIAGGVEEQTAHVMNSIRAILEAAGGTMDDLVKVNVHMRHVGEWHKMNEVYRTFFGDYLPGRMTMQAVPPLGFLVEIDAIAYLPHT
jgi:2-iminobutanoate/2-iminopropanoate deaminase